MIDKTDNSEQTYARQSYAHQALLPEGLRDLLPPHAEAEAATIRQLIDSFQSYGYDRVSPPLVEFEDSLLIGPASKNSDSMFRLMDPESRRVMAMRSDMTTQISRIAATRLKDEPRPLRLAYAGSVLRVKGSQIRPTRQFYQAGIELVGVSDVTAQMEVMRLAVEALEGGGVTDLSIDLTVAPFVPALCAAFGYSEQKTALVRQALDARDIGALEQLDGSEKDTFKQILQSAGLAKDAVAALESLDIPATACGYIDELSVLVGRLAAELPQVTVTVDPGESHGFDYKSGLGFALFTRNHHGELGRGGRYETAFADGRVEPATGFTMYLDSLMQALPVPQMVQKLYVAFDTPLSVAKSLRQKGWRVIQGLTDADNSTTQAQKNAKMLGCSHIHSNGDIIAL